MKAFMWFAAAAIVGGLLVGGSTGFGAPATRRTARRRQRQSPSRYVKHAGGKANPQKPKGHQEGNPTEHAGKAQEKSKGQTHHEAHDLASKVKGKEKEHEKLDPHHVDLHRHHGEHVDVVAPGGVVANGTPGVVAAGGDGVPPRSCRARPAPAWWPAWRVRRNPVQRLAVGVRRV